MSKFIYSTLVSIFFLSAMVTQGHAVTLEDCKKVCPAGGNCQSAYDIKWCGDCVEACVAAEKQGPKALTQEIQKQQAIEKERIEKATNAKQHHICAKICRGDGLCSFLTYDQALQEKCRNLVGKADCVSRCKNEICNDPNITTPNGDPSKNLRGQGSVHCNP